MSLFKIYQADDFDNWYQDFEKATNIKLTESNINLLKNWSISLLDFQNYLPLLGKGGFARAFLLNDKTVVKIDSVYRQKVLEEKLKNFPILNEYIVPTYIIMNQFHTIHTPDSLILQPYCQELPAQKYSEYKKSKKLDDLMKYYPDIDVCKYQNYGFLDNKLKLFDW